MTFLQKSILSVPASLTNKQCSSIDSFTVSIRYMSKPAFLETAASLLILLFLYTGLDKLSAHESFQLTLKNSPLLRDFATVISWAVPVAEMVAVMLLLIPFTLRAGFLASAALMLLFTLYVGYMLLFIPGLPCNCGGVIASLSWGQHLLLNIFFLAVSLAATFISFTRGKVAGDK